MRFASLALLVLAGCAPPRAAGPSERPAPPPPLTVRFPLPAKLPARYLRTLEHDPGGYDDASPPGGPQRGGASDLLLGDLLFHSPSTLGPRARALGISCQSCHPNGAANAAFALEGIDARPGNVDVTTEFFRKGSGDGIANEVNIPSLRGARFTGPYGHDGRTASLAEFTQGVVTTEFGGAPLDARELAALVRYVQDLDFLPNSNLDARSLLDERVSPAARRGESIFVRPMPSLGPKGCATCHDPSTFFRDGRVHRLGSRIPASPHAIEDGLETPTLLGTAETAPYFHDGRFRTLGEVVGWFDATYALGLSPAEREDLRRTSRRSAQSIGLSTIARSREGSGKRSRTSRSPRIRTPGCASPRSTKRASRSPARRRRWRRAPRRWSRVSRGCEPAPQRRRSNPKELRVLRRELTRLGADWAGALAP